MHDLGGEGINLWDEGDGFYYDVLHTDGDNSPLKVRSMVGLIPLFAVETLEPEIVEKLHGFKRRMQWFIDNHPEFREHVEMAAKPGVGRSEEHTSELQSQSNLVCRLLLEKKK